MQPIKVILNPYAGRGSGGRAKAQLDQALAQAGVTFDLVETNGVGHAIELARQARQDGYATIVAVGGDGTVSEVMNGIALATPADEVVGKLGVIPLGTGNDFTDMLGVPRDLDHAARRIAAGQTRRIDLGYATVQTGDQIQQRYFDNNLGAGFEAWVTLESYKIKRLSGPLLYVAAALRALNSYQPPHIELEWETAGGEIGRRSEKTLLVSVGNSRRTGGGFYLTPNAQIDDGVLDVALADAMSFLRTLFLLPRALMGKHTTDAAVTMLRCHRLQLTCDEGLPVHLDGEVIAKQANRIEICIQPGRLEVIV